MPCAIVNPRVKNHRIFFLLAIIGNKRRRAFVDHEFFARGVVLPCLFLALAGCGRGGDEVPGGGGIVTMAPHLTEVVFALGAGDRLVGVGAFCDYPQQVKNEVNEGGYIDPDLEKLALLSPDLLILPGKHEAVSEFAALRGLDVLNVHMDDFATIDAGIAEIGKALEVPGEADALRARVEEELAEVAAAVAGLPQPKVLIITTRRSHDLDTLYTAGGKSFVGEIVTLAGGGNIHEDAPRPYFEASKETIVVAAPDVILEFHCGEELDAAEEAAFKADWNMLKNVPAVQNGRR